MNMTTRFENGIVVTLGPNNQVTWNGSVVTDGETIVGVGDAAEMKKRFPDAESVDCDGKDCSAWLHLHPSPLLFHHGPRHVDSR